MRSLICTHLAPSVGHAWCKVHSTVAECMHYARMHPSVLRSVASQLTHPIPGINCDQRNQMSYVLQSAFSARAWKNVWHTVHNAWHSSIFCRQRGLFCLTAPCLELARRCHLLAVTQLMTDWSRCCVVLQRHRSASIMRAGPHPPTLRCK